MGNTHLQPSMFAETQAVCGDILPSCVISETWPAAAGSMTLPAFSTYGYVRNGTPTRLVYVNQPAAAVTLSGADGVFWLAMHHDTHSAVASWSRTPGTHYLWRSSATQPADPPGGLVFAKCTVAGGVVSAVDVVLHSYPRGRIPYGGATGALAYDQELTWNNVTKQVSAPMYLAYDYAGNDRIAFYSSMNAAGGTNKWAFFAAGTAPSAFNGEVTASSLLHWSSWATGYQLRLGDHVPPGYTFDCNGNAAFRAHVGIGVGTPPLPGQYHLNCGSANFTSVNTSGLTATTINVGTITATSTIHAYRLESDTWVTTNELNASARVLCSRLGISGGDPGTMYALYSAGGDHYILGSVGINVAPATGGYNFAANNIWSNDVLYVVSTANLGSLVVRGGSQFTSTIGVNYAADPGYWMRIPSIWADAIRMGSATVDTTLTMTTATVSGTLTAGTANVTNHLGVGGNVSATGNMYATIGAFGIGPQVGYYLSAANLYVSATTQMLGDVQCFAKLAVYRAPEASYWFTAQNAYINTATIGGPLGVTGTLNVTGNTSLGNDLFVTNRVGIGASVVAGWHLTLGGTGAQKVGGGPWADSSSRTMKRNIQRIPNALPLLLEQRGCMYEWEEATRAALLPGTRYGLVAEEVTLPQWRSEQEDGTVAIAANGFEALTIEALREIVTRLEALENARTD